MQDFFNNFFDRPYRTLQYPARNYAKSIEVNNDSYTLMIRKFMKGVSEQMINIIIKQHSIPEEEALDFIEYMISMNDKRKIEVEEIVEKCYKNGNSKLECAKILLDKYYKITKINVYNDKSENEEISEVSEGIKGYLKPKSEDDINKDLEKLDAYDILYNSIIKGYLPGIKLAIEKGVDLDEYEALDMAVGEDKLEVVKFLVDNGASINNDNIIITLQIAYENKNYDIIKYLINLYVKKYKDIDKLYQ